MKLAFVTETLNAVSGGVRCIINQLNGLRELGWDTSCYVQKDPGISWLPANFPIHPIEDYEPVDVLVSPYSPTAQFVAEAEASYKFYYVHAYEPLFPRPEGSGWKEMSEASYRLPLIIFCTTKLLKILLEAFYQRRTIDITVPGGVDLEVFRPLKKENPSVFIIDRRSSFRGVAEALEGVKLAQKYCPELKVFMTGGPAPPPAAEGVKNLEYVVQNEQAALARLYGLSTLFINPSWREGFSLLNLEAMAAKAAVITTPWGAMDLVFDKVNGLFVPSRNPQAIASALVLLCKHEAFRERLVENAYKTVQGFTWEASVRRLDKAIKEGMKNPELYLQPVDYFGEVL